MKRINYGEVSYLVGDEVADALVQFTARLFTAQKGFAVELNVLGPDGNSEAATFALGPGVLVTAETTRSDLDEPDNSAAISFMADTSEQLNPTAGPLPPEQMQAMSEMFKEVD